MEKQNWLRHIRVSNENDVVPVTPPGFGAVYETYMHTGINVHLIPGEGKHEIAYGNYKTLASQVSLWSYFRHALTDYWARQNEDKGDFKNHTIAGLYERHGPSDAKS
jgi:hypothetical protein